MALHPRFEQLRHPTPQGGALPCATVGIVPATAGLVTQVLPSRAQLAQVVEQRLRYAHLGLTTTPAAPKVHPNASRRSSGERA